MNGFLNVLLRKVVGALMSRRRSSGVLVLIALGVVAWRLISQVTPTAPAPGAAHAQKQDSSPQGTYSLAGKVVRIADGDTFTLLVNGHQERIRMASIDAPETFKDSQRPGQPMAQASKKELAGLIAGKSLSLICFEHDQYERNVCDVPLGDGATANQRQVATGMAWANMEGRGKYMRDPQIPGLEKQARRDRQGIWQETHPVQPWAWRYQCWKKAQC